MIFTWHATNAPEAVRYDDFRFIDPQVGWAINSAGQIIHTEDGFKTFTIQQTVEGPTWLRCMSFSTPTDGWVGTITRKSRLWRTQDGKTWADVTPGLPAVPSAVCGICSPSKNVVYGSGTQYPEKEAGIMKTTDGGATWTSISMAAHANLLIDNYFTDNLHGWVVGGKGGTKYPMLKPVVLFTADGGRTWENRLEAFVAARAAMARVPREINAATTPPYEPFARTTLAIEWIRRPTYCVVPQSGPNAAGTKIVHWVDVYCGPITFQVRDQLGLTSTLALPTCTHRTAVAVFLDGPEHAADPAEDHYPAPQ